MSSRKKVTIIVPVYADWASLQKCIHSLKQNIDTNVHSVILVNDCGPDVEALEINIKKAIKNTVGFHYVRNDKNLGFVKTCNRAVFELDKTTNDILLLNSDTETTAGFLDEMIAVLYSSDKIGAVSPRSNNATIATVPLAAASQKGIDPTKSYQLFQLIKAKLPRYNEVPTAHGFCMLIRRSLIKQYGLFDEAFGRGYGEEVDFCQRIAKHGYKSVLANHAYVFHLEARSFTLETKTKMLETNNKIIWQRYPKYRQSVRDYIDQALKQEELISPPKPISEPDRSKLKQLVKHNRTLFKIAKKLHHKLRTRR